MSRVRGRGMNNENHVLLEWSYTPANFFEEPVVISREGVEIHIDGGRATAKMEPESYDAEHRKREELHDFVRGYFKAEQVMTHHAFTLEKPSVTRVHADGRRDSAAFVDCVKFALIGNPVDFCITKADGTVVDTKKERLECKREFREACERLRHDWTLRRMIVSYGGAVNDPEDEFVHLYEIWDALKVRFDPKGRKPRKACEILGVDENAGSRFEALTNDRRLRQSRHRGQHLEELRDATAEELAEARGLARAFIEAYVRWLEEGS